MARSPADDLRIIRRFAEWTAQLPADIDATFGLLQHEGIAAPGRRVLVAGLSYLLTQFDLIPDHERIGTVDDAMVLRVAFGLAADHAAKAGSAESALVARFCNEDEVVREFLGDALYPKLRAYVAALADKTIRNRSADQVLADAEARRDLRRELDHAVKGLPAPLVVEDAKATDIAVSILGYLKIKLAG